jgi:hypothetical protein
MPIHGRGGWRRACDTVKRVANDKCHARLWTEVKSKLERKFFTQETDATEVREPRMVGFRAAAMLPGRATSPEASELRARRAPRPWSCCTCSPALPNFESSASTRPSCARSTRAARSLPRPLRRAAGNASLTMRRAPPPLPCPRLLPLAGARALPRVSLYSAIVAVRAAARRPLRSRLQLPRPPPLPAPEPAPPVSPPWRAPCGGVHAGRLGCQHFTPRQRHPLHPTNLLRRRCTHASFAQH